MNTMNIETSQDETNSKYDPYDHTGLGAFVLNTESKLEDVEIGFDYGYQSS